MTNFIKFAFFGLALSIAFNSWAKVTMSIDRTDIGAGETFVLDIQADQETDQQPDLSRIPKEFTIVSTSQYHNTQIYNGQRNTLIGWKIKLKTLQAGPITIPPITLGNEATQAIQLDIRDASNQVNIGGEAKMIFLEAEVDHTEAYVQQQLIYTVTLYRAVNTHYASLSEPQVENSILEKLGDDIQFEKYINNRRYGVTQRKYAIFPQQSGKLHISPVTFTADVNDNSQRSRNSFLSATRPISATTKPITIEVKHKPSSAANPWLPASDLILADKWTPNKATLKVGEPITWTLLLTAAGLTESQLPDINIPKVDGLQWYSDTPQKERQVNDKGIIGQRIEKLAVIPSKAGSVTIPEISVKWWNTETNSPQTATLPAHTFQILPAEVSSQVAPPIAPTPVEQVPLPTTQAYESSLRNWQIICASLLVLWLVTLAIYLRQRTQITEFVKQANSTNRRIGNLNSKAILKELNFSLKSANYEQTEIQLLKLINNIGYWKIRSLGALANQIKNHAVANKLRKLEALRYAQLKHEQSIDLDTSDIDQILKELEHREQKDSFDEIPLLYSNYNFDENIEHQSKGNSKNVLHASNNPVYGSPGNYFKTAEDLKPSLLVKVLAILFSIPLVLISFIQQSNVGGIAQGIGGIVGSLIPALLVVLLFQISERRRNSRSRWTIFMWSQLVVLLGQIAVVLQQIGANVQTGTM